MPVPGEIFTVYQSKLGQTATLLWLNFRWAAHLGSSFDCDEANRRGLKLDREAYENACALLVRHGLLERSGDGGVTVHEPGAAGGGPMLDAEETALRAVPDDGAEIDASGAAQAASGAAEVRPRAERPTAKQGAATGAKEPKGSKEDAHVLRSPLSKKRKQERMLKLVEERSDEAPQNEDMQAVVQIYHKRIGMIGPTQYEKLRFWVEEQGMDGAVVALAIEETVQCAEVPRISYLEGILRNWHNDGIRCLSDLNDRKRASKVLSKDRPETGSEGMPNASAYQSVNSELVEKWKELYPDEYDR